MVKTRNREDALLALSEAERRRFWVNVERKAVELCWPWKGSTTPNGYGCFRLNGDTFIASRAAYALAVGPIPTGMLVRHVECDNPLCCNPHHLAVGTAQDNSDDAARHERIGRRVRGRGRSSLTPARVCNARREFNEGVKLAVLASKYGVRSQSLRRALEGQGCWASVRLHIPSIPPIPSSATRHFRFVVRMQQVGPVTFVAELTCGHTRTVVSEHHPIGKRYLCKECGQ